MSGFFFPVTGLDFGRRSTKTEAPRSGHWIAALSIVAGIIWFWGAASILALAAGFVARVEAKASGASLVPSTVGLVLGAVGFVAGLVFLFLAVR